MSEEAKLLKAAEWYLKQGYSVIPIKKDTNKDKDKKALIKWTKFQTELSTIDDVKRGFSRTSKPMIAIVTGNRANLTVVDLDTIEAIQSIDDFLPESLEIPTVESPRGGRHLYFQHVDGLPTRSNILPGVDTRNEGGYIAVPSSTGINGKPYKWLNGCSLDKIKPPPMPEMLRDTLLEAAGAMPASSLERAYKNVSIPLYKNNSFIEGQHCVNNSVVNIGSTQVNKVNISFNEGGRDESLFHLANHLVKAGMLETTIRKYLYFFASNCNPPFPEKEINAKIESALKREKGRSEGLTAEIREIIESTQGNFSSTFIYQTSTKSTLPSDRRKISSILGRFVKDGYIERVGNQNGIFRRIEADCIPEDYENACTDSVNIWLPFELNEMLEILPGSIILFAGAQDAGKSAIAMNVAKENRKNWNVHYFSSELNAGAFKNRLNKFPDISIDQWKIKFYPRSDNFHDVIKTGPNDLNLIDYPPSFLVSTPGSIFERVGSPSTC